jgi:hypothetical protein
MPLLGDLAPQLDAFSAAERRKKAAALIGGPATAQGPSPTNEGTVEEGVTLQQLRLGQKTPKLGPGKLASTRASSASCDVAIRAPLFVTTTA